MKIAVLMTCYNRGDSTLRCLSTLDLCERPEGFTLDIYLVDDASPDHTGERVRETFPHVHVVEGTGDLYWCGGMRLAWKVACQRGDYDFYLWLNDDVSLFEGGLRTLVGDYRRLCTDTIGVVVGSCCDPDSRELTYGGRSVSRLLVPCGVPQACRYIHGNVVLVPKTTFVKMGGLCESFSHGFGDTDYGLRCIESGLTCWTSSAYVGTCRQHGIKGPWLSSKVPIRTRLRLLRSPVGANFKEYLFFRRQHWPRRWLCDGIKLLVQCVCPLPFEIFSAWKGRFSK